jgi:hypothetical protein
VARLLAGADLRPFVEAGRRHEAPVVGFERIAERWRRGDGFGTRADRLVPNRLVLRRREISAERIVASSRQPPLPRRTTGSVWLGAMF